MITQEKLAIYRKYEGDPDRFVRGGRAHEHEVMRDADWSAIDELLHLLHSLKCGYVSEDFAIRIRQKLHADTADESVRATLLSLA